MPTKYTKENPRFVWTVGAYRELYPDMPAIDDLCLYDRQELAPVVTVHARYAQLLCLETTREPGNAPFTALELWANSLSAADLKSEGIPS